jgi:hypothetical protein
MVTFIADKEGSLSLESSQVSIPGDRHFREAWSLNETWDVVVEDLDTAKSIFKDRVRTARKPLLEALDVDYIRALEEGASTDAIVTKKQSLRDSPAAGNIDNAADISALKASWDTGLLGENPYG